MSIKSIFLGLLALLIIAAIALSSGLFDINQVASNATRTNKQDLFEKNHTVFYQPGKDDEGVPMAFDRLALTNSHNIEYYAKHGYIGFKDEKNNTITKNWLNHSGFPVINFTWPSLALKPTKICDPKSPHLEKNCPTNFFKLISRDSTLNKHYKIIKEEQAFVDQTKIMPKFRRIYQWSAFFTDKKGSSQVQNNWLGWQCDAERLKEKSTLLGAWGWEEKIWALDPQYHKNNCYSINSHWQKQLLRYKPDWAKVTENPVIWSCPQYRENEKYHGACFAFFMHQGRIIELELPAYSKHSKEPPYKAQHHLIIQAAWQWLQNAAQLAEKQTSDTTITAFNTKEALATELAWCKELDKESRRLAKKSKQHAKAVGELWDKTLYEVTSIYPLSACSRVFHRVLQVQEMTPQQRKQLDFSDKKLLAVVNSLANIEKRHNSQDNEQPLRELKLSLLKKVHGENSVPVFKHKMSRRFIFKKPLEALALYEAFGSKIDKLSATERSTIRLRLSRELWDSKYKAQNPQRRKLMWDIVKEISNNRYALDPRDSTSALQYAGIYTRNRDISDNEDPPELADLITQMESLAKRMAVDTSIPEGIRKNDIAVLGLNAAWHANLEVVRSNRVKHWQEWLKQWYFWIADTLNVDPDDEPPHWLEGIKAHVIAAQQKRLTEPDCAGGYHNSCRLGLHP